MAKTRVLKLSDITADKGVQPRAKGTDKATAQEFAAAIKAGAEFPPMVVYEDKEHFWLSEGFTRHAGYTLAGTEKVACEVREGDRRAAILNACGSNVTHGQRRTNADKRRAVELVLKEYPSWSNKKVADVAAVSHDFVGSVRGESGHSDNGQLASDASSNSSDNQTEGRDGRRRGPKHQAPKAKPETESGDEEPEPETTVNPPVQVDGWGIPVQPHAAEAFAAVPKFKELVAAIQAAQRLFNDIANSPGGKFLQLPEVSSYRRGKKGDDGEHADRFVHEGLERAYQQVKNAAPAHTVCPYQFADAPHPKECTCCRGLNWTPALGDNIPAVCVERAKKKLGGEARADV